MKILVGKRTNDTSKMSSKSYCGTDVLIGCIGDVPQCRVLKKCPGPTSPGLIQAAPPLPPPPKSL